MRSWWVVFVTMSTLSCSGGDPPSSPILERGRRIVVSVVQQVDMTRMVGGRLAVVPDLVQVEERPCEVSGRVVLLEDSTDPGRERLVFEDCVDGAGIVYRGAMSVSDDGFSYDGFSTTVDGLTSSLEGGYRETTDAQGNSIAMVDLRGTYPDPDGVGPVEMVMTGDIGVTDNGQVTGNLVATFSSSAGGVSSMTCNFGGKAPTLQELLGGTPALLENLCPEDPTPGPFPDAGVPGSFIQCPMQIVTPDHGTWMRSLDMYLGVPVSTEPALYAHECRYMRPAGLTVQGAFPQELVRFYVSWSTRSSSLLYTRVCEQLTSCQQPIAGGCVVGLALWSSTDAAAVDCHQNYRPTGSDNCQLTMYPASFAAALWSAMGGLLDQAEAGAIACPL
ncbi:MAG: hypothetical protein JNL83_07840 [Myxococcales bacterium]|nr:hypothetical protein [Myxococcales bacterium]